MGDHSQKLLNSHKMVKSCHKTSNRKCRLCLASLDTMIELFSGEAVRMKINDKLREFCHLVIKEEDVVPKTICFTCLNEVNRFCDFYRRVQDNQKLLAISCKAAIVEGDLEKLIAADEQIEDEEQILIAITEGGANLDETESIGILITADEGLVETSENVEFTETYPVEEIDNGDEMQEEDPIERNSPRLVESECEEPSSYVGYNVLATSDPNDQQTSKSDENLELATSTKSSNRQQQVLQTASPLTKDEDCTKRRAKHRIALDKPIREFFDLYCEKCQMNFQTFQSTKNHMAQIHNEQLSFVCCNRKLYRRDIIMEHINSHLNPKEFVCEICSQVCKSKITLKTHLKQHIPKDQRPFPCEKCGYRFALKSQLKSHMNTHLTNDEKRFVCDMCDKAFAFKFVLEKHKRRIHIGQKNYMCEICARSFVDKNNLTAHKQIHDTSLPRLECSKCNALLKTKKTLKIHMRVHEPSHFLCEMCFRVFPTKNGLLNHIRYYHTDRKYPCTTCGRIFKKALNLKEHMATHTGEVLYNCEYCDKTFNAKANRYAHIKKVHPAEWANKQKLRWRVENEKYSE